MEERTRQDRELAAQDIQADTPPQEDVVPAQKHDALEPAELQPQYDSFMRVIRR